MKNDSLESIVTFADAGELGIDRDGALFIQGEPVNLFQSVDWMQRHGAVAPFEVHPGGWTRWLALILTELSRQPDTVATFERDCRAAGLRPRWVPTDAACGPGVAEGKRGGLFMQFCDGFGRVTPEEERDAFRLSRKYPHQGQVVTFNRGKE